jgi:hypothetical protein
MPFRYPAIQGFVMTGLDSKLFSLLFPFKHEFFLKCHPSTPQNSAAERASMSARTAGENLGGALVLYLFIASLTKMPRQPGQLPARI